MLLAPTSISISFRFFFSCLFIFSKCVVLAHLLFVSIRFWYGPLKFISISNGNLWLFYSIFYHVSLHFSIFLSLTLFASSMLLFLLFGDVIQNLLWGLQTGHLWYWVKKNAICFIYAVYDRCLSLHFFFVPASIFYVTIFRHWAYKNKHTKNGSLLARWKIKPAQSNTHNPYTENMLRLFCFVVCVACDCKSQKLKKMK